MFVARVIGDASKRGLGHELDYCEGIKSWERNLDRARTGVQFKSPHLVTEEQGMCKLPPERRLGARTLAENACVPGFGSVLKLQVKVCA